MGVGVSRPEFEPLAKALLELSGSLVRDIGALVAVPQDVGWASGLTVNAGTESVVTPTFAFVPANPLLSQTSVPCSRPVLPYAFEIQTYGGRPLKIPTPPRSRVAPLPLRS